MKKFLVPLLCLSSGAVLASESNCDYKTNVNTDFQGTISSSKNYNQKSYPYVDDTRICIVEMDVFESCGNEVPDGLNCIGTRFCFKLK